MVFIVCLNAEILLIVLIHANHICLHLCTYAVHICSYNMSVNSHKPTNNVVSLSTIEM